MGRSLKRSLAHLFQDHQGRDNLISITTQFANAALSMVTAVLFARLLGASQFGAYTVAFAWASLLAAASRMGLDVYLTRELSVALERRDWACGLASILNVLAITMLASAVLGLAMYLLFACLEMSIDPVLHDLIGYTSLLVPVLSLEVIAHTVLKTAGHNTAAALIRFLVRPLLLTLLLLAAAYLNLDFRGGEAVLSQISTLLISVLLLWRAAAILLPSELADASNSWDLLAHVRGGLPFLAIAGMGLLMANTDLVMLGAMSTPEEAGKYRVASRIASVIGLTLTAVSLPLAPRLAAHYHGSRIERLRRDFARANALGLLLAVPMGILFILFRVQLLSIFGDEFAGASALLVGLTLLGLYDVFMGPAAMCLSMTGGEKAVSRALGAACILNIALNAALIPSQGAMGAVMASALSSVLWKFAVWLLLYQRFAILPAGLGLLAPERTATGA